MGKLGKIFGILVLVLAIVVAVFSFLLSKHRDLFKNRAADLAEGIVKTGQTLSGGSGQSNPVSFTPASGGIRIEDDLLITNDGCRFLGHKRIPYHPAELEEFMAK